MAKESEKKVVAFYTENELNMERFERKIGGVLLEKVDLQIRKPSDLSDADLVAIDISGVHSVPIGMLVGSALEHFKKTPVVLISWTAENRVMRRQALAFMKDYHRGLAATIGSTDAVRAHYIEKILRDLLGLSNK